ncbi:MAG: hypothetical protein OCC46_13525 [Pseudodesulfovibrio sp.]
MKCNSVLMTAMALLLMCSAAMAGDFVPRGTAIVPGTDCGSSSTTVNKDLTYFWLTNITGKDVTCKATFYDHNGTEVTSVWDVYTGSDTTETATNLVMAGDGSFELPAAATRLIIVRTSNQDTRKIGHTVFEWSSEDPYLRKALMVNGKRRQTDSQGVHDSALSVNNGLPF